MKSKYIYLLAIILFMSCKKSDGPMERDDTFFDGIIGSILYDSIPNEYRSQKLIRTIQEIPVYCFILSDTFETPHNTIDLASIELQFNISKLTEGKEYAISEAIRIGNTDRQGVLCKYTKRSVESPTKTEETSYTPNVNNPFHLLIKKVENGNVTNATIVEGKIKGYLFNVEDQTVSIAINATFRTKMYRD